MKEEWFVIGDDAMTVATRRTAGSIYSTAGFTVGDDTDEEGSGYDNGEEKGPSAATHVSFVGMSAHHLMASGGGHGFVDHGLVGVSGVLDE